MLKLKNQQKKKIEIKSLEEDKNTTDWFDRNKFEEIQLFLTATNLITGIKQVNSSILALEAWLIILEIIQLVKQMLKKSYIH